MQTLRPYQTRTVDKATTLANAARKPIVASPTGSGKTTMATAIVDRFATRTLWLAHRKELIEQAATRLQSHGLSTGIIKAGVAASPLARVQVASVQTLVNRKAPPAELIVIDEAHHAAADSYGSILSKYPGTPVVGLTATPYRLDGKGLGDIFDSIVVAATPLELVDAGYLVAPKVWAAYIPNLIAVKKTAGDFNRGQLEQQENTDKIRADIVSEWERHAIGMRTVCFAINVKHSQAIVDAFRARGHAAEHVDGNTKPDERDAILDRLASGRTTIVSNCDVLTEGWDLPALEALIMARPTSSLNIHIQQAGRVMRTADGKAGAIILDHAGNHQRHGHVTREIDFTLDATAKTTSAGEPLGLRRCNECGLYFAPTLYACPECGWHPEPPKPNEIAGEGTLEQFEDRETYAGRAQEWAAILKQKSDNGFDMKWAHHRYRDTFDAWPIVIDGELVNVDKPTREQKRATFVRLVKTESDKGYAEGWASHRYREAFGVWPSGFVGEVRRQHATTAARVNRKMQRSGRQ